ncbi:uncharacterized protein H6S33_004941 [Morchella sextelata]|uniref:uncharacterized protein n=1 Tax=Morchella sextelata TaxID=1174677 RepID=UPI001D046F07|nr:uncharacterized protein H6S33_004941 [Morchella sextelata]KAH0604959.1 hypothetical protein H6S33_004941 [Morchella sextelata]
MPKLVRLLPLSLLVHIPTAKSFTLTNWANNRVAEAGIELSLGTPSQFVYLAPSVNDDEIFVVGPDACTPTCLTRNGAQFNTSISSTWRPTANVTIGNAGAFDWWNGSQVEFTLGYEQGQFVDAPENTNFSNLGIKIAVLNEYSPDDSVPTPNTLGLGSNSTFLNSLVRNGVIESRSFGLYEKNVDIGPFNESRIVGKRYSSPIVQNTGYLGGLQVTVTDMTINGKSLMNRTSGPFNATLGLSTGRASYVPQVVAEDFYNVTNADAPTNWSTYDEPVWNQARSSALEPFIMVVKLSNGATLNVPSSLLRVPIWEGNDTGLYYISQGEYYTYGSGAQPLYKRSNMVGIDLLDAEVKADNPGVEALLGMDFVSYRTYLYVDWDKQEFELAELKDIYSSAGVVQISWRTTWAVVFLSVVMIVMF